jgi:hypothetical protein
LIAALNAAVYSDVANRENVDPLALSAGKPAENPFLSNDAKSDNDESESSFETVIRYNSKPDGLWSQSTPATTSARGRKSTSRRKSTKRKSSTTTGLYPEISVYPDILEVRGDVPTTSTEEFGKIAEGILEEMNARVACMSFVVHRLKKS